MKPLDICCGLLSSVGVTLVVAAVLIGNPTAAYAINAGKCSDCGGTCSTTYSDCDGTCTGGSPCDSNCSCKLASRKCKCK